MSFLLHLILHLIMLIEASEHTLEGKIDAEFNRIRLLKYKSGANCVKNNEKSLYNRLSVWKLLCPLQGSNL